MNNNRRDHLLTKQAQYAYASGKLELALSLYRQASERYGSKLFQANIRLLKNRIKASAEPRQSAILFTNLGLGQIDGSVVFMANALRIFSIICDEVYLVTVNAPGDNFIKRCRDIHNLSILEASQAQAPEIIKNLCTSNNIELVFARLWGNAGDWIHESMASKVVYYFPLNEHYSDYEKALFEKVGCIAVQTKQLKERVEKTLGPKRSILFPPLVETPKKLRQTEEITDNFMVRIAYTGTLRPECFSIQMLQSFQTLLDKYSFIDITIAAGKIFYKDKLELDKLIGLLDQLCKLKNFHLLHQISHDECANILQNSDISLSLWEVTSQNETQVSTKLLECLSADCITICFKTELYKELLGNDYKYFLSDIGDLDQALELSMLDIINKKHNRVTNHKPFCSLDHFSLESHVIRVAESFGHFPRKAQNFLSSSFSKDFDCIYGLHINENEKTALEYIAKRTSIDIKLFKGIDGSLELTKEFEEYSALPLSTEWEAKAKKKRLTIGAMGHLHSFINIARDAIRRGYQKILVLESDVIFHKHFFRNYFNRRFPDYKLLYLGAGKWHPIIDQRNGYYMPNKTTGTFAIAFDASILDECINEWQKMLNPTDIALIDICKRYPSECFVYSPNLIICDLASSSTTTPRSQKDLSDRFGWELSQYDVCFVRNIDCYVNTLKIVINYLLPGAELKIHFRGGDYMYLHPSATGPATESYLINNYIKYIEYSNLFITDFDFS